MRGRIERDRRRCCVADASAVIRRICNLAALSALRWSRRASEWLAWLGLADEDRIAGQRPVADWCARSQVIAAADLRHAGADRIADEAMIEQQPAGPQPDRREVGLGPVE